jgi:hypothetical protein
MVDKPLDDASARAINAQAWESPPDMSNSNARSIDSLRHLIARLEPDPLNPTCHLPGWLVDDQ